MRHIFPTSVGGDFGVGIPAERLHLSYRRAAGVENDPHSRLTIHNSATDVAKQIWPWSLGRRNSHETDRRPRGVLRGMARDSKEADPRNKGIPDAAFSRFTKHV